MKHPFSAEEGMQALLQLPVTTQRESLPLLSAQGRILAETIYASVPVPPFSKSPYDGYALRSEDTLSASEAHPVTLQITEELPAGTPPTLPVTKGMAAKILTGAAVPEGADAIIKYEETTFSETTVTLYGPCKPGNIVPVGEDVQAGQELASCGTVITGAVMGVLAGQGIDCVTVFRRPKIVVISTGSELISVGHPLQPGTIYNTNIFTIGGLLQSLGAEVLDGGLVEDHPDTLANRISREMEYADMIITTGGASVGDYDYTEAAFLSVGGSMLFKRLNFKPGGAMMAALQGQKVLLGLSGNPGAAAIGLLRIAAPYIRALTGQKNCLFEEIQVALRYPLKKASPKMRFLRGYLQVENGQAFFVENHSQANGSVSSLVHCDLLAEIPANSSSLEAGTLVKAYRVPE